MAAKKTTPKKGGAVTEEAGAINVADRKLMVKWSCWMGSVVNHGDTVGKVISIGKTYVTIRPIYESRPFDLPHVRFPVATMQYTTGAPWTNYYRLYPDSIEAILAIYEELFGKRPEQTPESERWDSKGWNG